MNGKQDPMLDYFRLRLQEERGSSEADSAQAHIMRSLMERRGIGGGEEGPQDPLEAIKAKFGYSDQITGPIEGVAAPFFAGMAEKGALQPFLEAPLSLARDIAGAIGWDAAEEWAGNASDFFRRLQENMLTTAEANALEGGAEPEDIARAHMVGSFVGYVAPIAGSIKLASWALRTPVALLKYPYAGHIITDTAAGMIFGGVMEPADDIGDRAWNVSREAGLFGAFRLAAGAAIPLKTWRDKRMMSSLDYAGVRDLYVKMSRGEALTRRESRIATNLMNEEGYLSASPAAQEMFAKGMEEVALIRAIVDQGGNRSAAGVVREIGSNLQEVNKVIEAARVQMPHMKFNVVNRKPRGEEPLYDLYFGLKGLNNKQLKQLKAEGRFEGQLLRHTHNNAEYRYVGLGKKEGYVEVERLVDGKRTQIRADNLTDLPNYTESVGPEIDALYQNFRKFYMETAEQLRLSQKSLTEYDMIEMIRKGELQLNPNARRAFNAEGAIVYPEELGVKGLSKLTTPEEILTILNQEGFSGGSRILESHSYTTFDDLFTLWVRERGLTDTKDIIAARIGFSSRLRREMWNAVPAEERKLFTSLMDEQMKLIEEGRVPLSALAHQKGFHIETLADGSIMLREVNSGMKTVHQTSDIAEEFLKRIVRTEQDLPSILPELRSSGTLFSGGMPDVGSAWQFEKLVSLEPSKIPPGRFRNLMNTMDDIEWVTKVPFFSKGFLPTDQGVIRMRAELAPWAKEIHNVWKGISVQRQGLIADVWRAGEKEAMTNPQVVKLLKEAGASSKEINAFLRTRKMLDKWFEVTGMDAEKYVTMYFSRIRPYLEKTRGMNVEAALRGADLKPQEFSFWAEHTRTGDLSTVEKNIELVLHKYARAMLWRKHVQPHWERLATLTGTRGGPPLRFRDLEPAQAKTALDAAKKIDSSVDMNSSVIPDVIRRSLMEYLNAVRGTPNASFVALRDFTERTFAMFGLKLDGRVGEELIGTLMTNQYGALIGARPWHVARNITQVPWMMYPRLGNRHMHTGLERALSREGVEEIWQEGVYRLAEGGLPFMDTIYRAMRELPMDVTNPLGYATRAVVQSLLRAGKISRSVANKFLVYYTSGDSLNRGWSYFWQKNHTAEWLAKFQGGAISWEKFTEKGMPFFSPNVHTVFRDIFRTEGPERALRYIGKQASDQLNFIYGGGVQPAWMQTWYGRMFGTFGTWPLWAVEGFMTQLKHGNPMQKAAFGARVGVVSAIFSNIMLQTGFNLWSWFAPGSVTWAGGPYLDVFNHARNVISGPIDQKAGALKSLWGTAWRLNVPGYSAYMDIQRTLDATDPMQQALGMFLGKPMDDIHWALDVIYNPDLPPGEIGSEGRQMLFEDWIRPGMLGPPPELPMLGSPREERSSVNLRFGQDLPRIPEGTLPPLP